MLCLFNFRVWIRRIKDLLGRRGKARAKPARKPHVNKPAQLRPELLPLEDRSSFGDVGLGAVATAAGIGGAAAFLFREAITRVMERPAEHVVVDYALVDPGTSRPSPALSEGV